MTTQERAYPSLKLEWVDPQAIGVKAEPVEVSNLLLRCLEHVAAAAPHPDRVSLVITGDFAASVQARIGNAPGQEPYALGRGSGFVGGKTISMPDDRIDVILHAIFFAQPSEPQEQTAPEQLTKRTLAHETQHVVMRQNDQSYRFLQEASFRSQSLTSGADSIIDEYRAELGVDQELRQGDTRWDASSVLGALGEEFGHVTASYQAHGEVPRLNYEVGTAALIAWRSLAYMAAWNRAIPETISLTEEASTHPLWTKMVAGRWGSFVQILDRAEPGSVKMSTDAIAAIVRALADLLADWLSDLGFDWTEDQFRIHHWYFKDPYYLEAIKVVTAPFAPRSNLGERIRGRHTAHDSSR